MNATNLQNAISGIQPIDVRTELFRKRDFSFIVSGKDEDGVIQTHFKQKTALEILTSNQYEEFLYGGAAGGAKSWTGCVWILFMCLCFPGTRYFIARNELKDIVDSVLVTFKKVCREYGFSDFKYNAVKNFIEFGNGSHINFIEIKYKPSDPMFEDVGSTEYTAGWIEEVGEIDETGADVISSRVGRYMNKEYGIKGCVLYTCNPKKNWAKTRFYDRAKNNTLPEDQAYLQCLITENPFIEKEYVEKLRKMATKNKSLYERLFKGNWDYEDNPNALCDYEMIEQVFDNNHVQPGTKYITVDAARLGSDKAVILVWSGWKVIDRKTMDVSRTTDISNIVELFRVKYGIPKNHITVDADGIGGGVIDEIGSGVVEFNNNGKVLKEDHDTPNYRNLQVQCLYHLAEKVNNAELWIAFDASREEKEMIKEELDQIQSKLNDYGKLDCKPKSEIRKDIGRSPDYRDALFMRVIFDLRPTRRKGIFVRPRKSI